jgi:hypothetical protein
MQIACATGQEHLCCARQWDSLEIRAVEGEKICVFLRRGTLMAAPFDLDRLEFTGPPVPGVAL